MTRRRETIKNENVLHFRLAVLHFRHRYHDLTKTENTNVEHVELVELLNVLLKW